MLLDLNKEIMNELGVTVVGDIIAILKHAKVVHRQVGTLLGHTGGWGPGPGSLLRCVTVTLGMLCLSEPDVLHLWKLRWKAHLGGSLCI